MIITNKGSYALNKRKILQWLKNSEYTLSGVVMALKISGGKNRKRLHKAGQLCSADERTA